MKAQFQIRNVIDMVPAMPLAFTFTQRGGTIGSAEDAAWRIQHVEGGIADVAARIVVIDGHFTLAPLSETPIHINGGQAPMTRGRPVILTDKDVLMIGGLNCLVSIGTETSVEVSVPRLATFARSHDPVGGRLLKDGEPITEKSDVHPEPGAGLSTTDPIELMDRKLASHKGVDPLAALEQSRARLSGPEERDLRRDVDASLSPHELATIPDHSSTPIAAHSARAVGRDRFGFEDLAMDDPSNRPHPDRAGINLSHPVDHVALLPLTRALGLPLGDMTAEEAGRTLAEIGGALREAVAGLVRLHQARSQNGRRMPFAGLHMHALEDNPLRFASDTDEALSAMFAKRGAVHQAAPSAFAEMMEHLDMHQSATEEAIGGALDAVLTSLMPTALEKRFRSYNTDDLPPPGPERDAWCWRMFTTYFAELRANRQRGLQMLFWEVFQHEYQGSLRAKRGFVGQEGALA
jgi:type VI secretion system protein ImpI